MKILKPLAIAALSIAMLAPATAGIPDPNFKSYCAIVLKDGLEPRAAPTMKVPVERLDHKVRKGELLRNVEPPATEAEGDSWIGVEVPTRAGERAPYRFGWVLSKYIRTFECNK